MKDLIIQAFEAFGGVKRIDETVQDGYWDLRGPKGEVLHVSCGTK